MKFLLGLFVGACFAVLAMVLVPSATQTADSADKKPLYWVAPMDANYRRDGPGKSPMGMDLIPVYDQAETSSPGSVEISAAVENNLGVRMAPVAMRKLSANVSTVGYVGFDQDTLVHLHPRVEGWVEKLYVTAEGDPVKKGQPLYDLYSPELVSAQEDLLLALRRGEERLIEGAKSRLRALKLAERTIEDLLKSRKVMQTVTYYAPQSGVVEALAIREGFYVQPGSTLMSIGALDTVWIEADVFARQTNLIRAGLKVDIQVPHLPGRHFAGELAYVYPSLTTDTRTLRVRIRFDNREKLLLPNMFAELNISGDVGDPVLSLPRQAVIRTGDQNRVVLALGAGRFKSVEVQLGRMDQAHIEITQGVSEGDVVVISGQFLLDSESSKSSDFLRMTNVETEPDTQWVIGKILSIDRAARTLTIDHRTVAVWGWPSMVMDFSAAADVDVENLDVEQTLDFQLDRSKGNLVISGVRTLAAAAQEVNASAIAEVEGVINDINVATRYLNISREAIAKWNRPAATLDFYFAEQIDISTLKVGQKIRFRFSVSDGEFIVHEIVQERREASSGVGHHEHGGQL